MKLGRKPEYPEKTPGDELQNMYYTYFIRHDCMGGHLGVTSGWPSSKQDWVLQLVLCLALTKAIARSPPDWAVTDWPFMLGPDYSTQARSLSLSLSLLPSGWLCSAEGWSWVVVFFRFVVVVKLFTLVLFWLDVIFFLFRVWNRTVCFLFEYSNVLCVCPGPPWSDRTLSWQHVGPQCAWDTASLA